MTIIMIMIEFEAVHFSNDFKTISINFVIVQWRIIKISFPNMITRVLGTQKISDKVYYFVEWANESQKPSWVTKEAYPQVRALLHKAGVEVEEEAHDTRAFKSHLPSVITDFLKWKGQKKAQMEKLKKKKQTYAVKLRKEGVEKYQLTILQKLELKHQQLQQDCERHRYKVCLDYQIDFVEGVYLSKTKEICFIVNVIGKNQKFAIPMSKMKKHYPRSLKEYLAELVNVHKFMQTGEMENIMGTSPLEEKEIASQKQSSSHNIRSPSSRPEQQAEESSQESLDSKPPSEKQFHFQGESLNSMAYGSSLQQKPSWNWDFQQKKNQQKVIDKGSSSQFPSEQNFGNLSSSSSSSESEEAADGEDDDPIIINQ